MKLLDYGPKLDQPTVAALEHIRAQNVVPDEQMELIGQDPIIAGSFVKAYYNGNLNQYVENVNWYALDSRRKVRPLPPHAIAISQF